MSAATLSKRRRSPIFRSRGDPVADPTLYTRLAGIGGNKIELEYFSAGMNEYVRGRMTLATIGDTWVMTIEQRTQLATLASRMLAPVDPLSIQELVDILLVSESDIPLYKTEADIKARLGVP